MSADIRRPEGMTPAAAEQWDVEVEMIMRGFEFELCDCGGDLDEHVISAGPFGNAQVWCKREGL